jgi:transmembrane sensor
MSRISEFLEWFKRRGKAAGSQPAGPPALEELMDNQARRLHEADPDTAQQWRYLNVALQRGASPKNVRKPARASRLLHPAISYSGILAVVLVIAGVVWLNRSSVLTYETGKGEQSSIMLSDSSEVTLNHTSTLIVESRPFGGTRHVSLKGEAYFHVRRNGSPFIVTTDVGTVQVLGTEFDVKTRGRQLVVGVVNGSVRVSSQHQGKDSSVVLTAGQIVACTKEEYPGAPAALPFADYPGWTRGKLLFYRTSLLSACKEIESVFDVQIHAENVRAGDETITGVVDGSNAETAILALSNLTGNKFRHEKNVYTLY